MRRAPGRQAAAATTVAFALGLAGTAMAQDHGEHGQQPTATAQDHSKMDHSQMDHSKMDHSKMDHSRMDHSRMDHSTMDHSTEGHPARLQATQGARWTAPPPLTDADRAAAFPTLSRHVEHAPAVNRYLLFDRLEAWDEAPGIGQAWEAQGWIGTDTDRLWLRSEGERGGGDTHAADLELLYGHSVSPWWEVLAGVRHDFAPGDSRTWAAFGMQGLAPYLFEVSITGYLGESGHTALAMAAEYELLLTNRLILQPAVEATVHGKEDVARSVGAGLSTAEVGLRLRYEVNRHVAPYVGLVHERALGDTARLRHDAGAPAGDTRLVAGIRFWF